MSFIESLRAEPRSPLWDAKQSYFLLIYLCSFVKELPEGVSLPAGRQGFINVLYGSFPALSADRQAQIYPDLSGPQD